MTAPDTFQVTVGFSNGEAVLDVRGDLDMSSSPELRAMLQAMIDRGHLNVVLNLAELNFIDASGLGVVAVAARQLRLMGGLLTLWYPSALMVRILEITNLARVIGVEPIGSHLSALGPEEVVSERAAAYTNALDDVPVRATRHMAVTSIDRGVVDGALQLVVNLAKATVGGADGVSVSLRRDGQFTTVAASDQVVLEMDADQYASGEGPCLDASTQGRWFHIESLEHEERWAAFAPLAWGLGIRAILSNPILEGDRPVGALNIYSRAIAAFGPEEQKIAAKFASEASVILSEIGVGIADVAFESRIQHALRSREVIAQAQGILMERSSSSETAAFDRLRHTSQATDRPLREHAAEIVASTRRSTTKTDEIAPNRRD